MAGAGFRIDTLPVDVSGWIQCKTRHPFITTHQDPVSYAWRGGSSFAAMRGEFANVAMTKYQYEEEGLHHGLA